MQDNEEKMNLYNAEHEKVSAHNHTAQVVNSAKVRLHRSRDGFTLWVNSTVVGRASHMGATKAYSLTQLVKDAFAAAGVTFEYSESGS